MQRIEYLGVPVYHFLCNKLCKTAKNDHIQGIIRVASRDLLLELKH